jgi:hypothetical protein
LELADHAYRQEEVVRVVEQGNEAEPQVELAGRIIDRFDLYGPNADVLGEVLGSPQGVDEEIVQSSPRGSAKVFLVPLGGPGESGVGSSIGVVEQVDEPATIPVGQLGHIPLLDDGTGLLNERTDGEVAHRLPERGGGLLDDLLEIGREPEVQPGVPGSWFHDSPRDQILVQQIATRGILRHCEAICHAISPRDVARAGLISHPM